MKEAIHAMFNMDADPLVFACSNMPGRNARHIEQTVAVLTCPFLPRVDTIPAGTVLLNRDDVLKLLLETAKLACTA